MANTVKKLPAFDLRYGTLSVPLSTYKSLNPAIAQRALSVWMKYIGGMRDVRKIFRLYRLTGLMILILALN